MIRNPFHSLSKSFQAATFVCCLASLQCATGADAPVNSRDDKVIAVEKEVGSPILQVAQTAPGLTFNVVNVADKFDDAMLAKFAPIAEKLEDVNLGRSKITDAGAAQLAAMKNLVRLRLDNTALTDAAVDHLLALQKLEYLNLYGTKVSDAGLAKLEKLPNLRALYVWQTAVTKPAAEALHAKLPKLMINLGWDNVVGQPAPPAPQVTAKKEEKAAEEMDPKKADPEATVYAAIVQPILNRTCTACHGTEKKKGKLAMHDHASLVKNGDSGEPSVVAGKHAESLIIKRIALPKDNDEHMPPEEKPQPSDREVALLKWWIDAGAKTDVKVKDAGIPADLLK